ncbi:macrophage colony-stimulating factor 1 receptor 2-like isoform X2 [Periophthalmus magnuspinnatus]|uniref:macrophage colony-stimulating factor 1 receptor 2-like isoform X2 n=1 Tax=Periophthalmus magnuspinnatus TaxID=409849 RepID=UPI00145B6817|nr:macrophage colony-stimulating factor 1 receptor 2-like isoform X2 [Periophthalmus magnuspinnatus]
MLRSLVLILVLGAGLSQEVLGALQISVNDYIIPDQSERTLLSGSALSVRCLGDGPLLLQSTSFRLMHDALGNHVTVTRTNPRYTGTYTCSAPANHSSVPSTAPPTATVHLYVSDPSDPSSAFVVPRSRDSVEEGRDFLLRCLPTGADITELSVQSDSEGRGLPQGMTFTFDPRRGALVHAVQRSFEGWYRCRGRRNGQEVTSAPIYLWVEHKLEDPPSLSVSLNTVIRLVGERFEVTCFSSNKNHFFNLTWTRPPGQLSSHSQSVAQSHSQTGVFINRTLVLVSVQTQDSGVFTCTGVNKAGVSRATTHLEVRERPFVTVSLRLHNVTSLIANVTHGNSSITAASTARGVATEEVGGVSRLEVSEGKDLSLTLPFEAYPPIRTFRWVTPGHMTNSSLSTEEHRPQEHRAELKLLIGRVHRRDTGRYSLLFSNDFFSGNISLLLRVHYPPVAQVLRLESGLVCRGSGFPLPSLIWTSCPGVTDRCEDGEELDSEEQAEGDLDDSEDLIEDMGEESVERPLTLQPSPGDDITVVCSASNHMGQSRDMLQLREPESLFHPLLIGSFCVGGVLLLLLMVAVWKWKQKPRYEIRWKIIDSYDGNTYTFVDPSQLPYDQQWEFPRDRLRLGAVLGSGAFGKVVAATALGLNPEQNETTVAVKMLKPGAVSEDREALMSELKILSYIGFHQNIVNLLGACTRGGPMLMITEYCRHGDLLNFLRTRSHHFLSDEKVLYRNMGPRSTKERPRSDSGISCSSEYQEMKPLGPRPGSRPGPRLGPGLEPASDVPSLSLVDLMRFSLEVAEGLDFLSSKNCIHRDVAARNVLLTEHCVAKICDFGLARDIRNDDSYIVKGNARLPVKWMSPESIFLCVYTTQSDVWSYGVLLWEIYSMGRSPYPNMAVDSKFYRSIKDGVHMERPDFAPAEMYDLMTRCWDLEPTRRPTFNTIGQIISGLLPSTNHTPPPQSPQVIYSNINETRDTRDEDKPNHADGGSEVNQAEPQRNIYQLS